LWNLSRLAARKLPTCGEFFLRLTRPEGVISWQIRPNAPPLA
jgi:hypothetical protein